MIEIRSHNGGWAIFAEWFGELRPVFGGAGVSIWDCLDHRAELT